MRKILTKYEKLPSWLRWVLFLPIIFSVSLVLGVLILGLGPILFQTPSDSLRFKIVHAFIMQSVLLASIFYIAPNGKFLLLKIFIGVRSLWLLLLLTLLIFPFFYETKIENFTSGRLTSEHLNLLA